MNIIIAPIRKEVILQASQKIAFTVFTAKIDSWWPKTHHIGSTPMKELVLEPIVGGRWYSKHEDGSEVNVGKVIVWDPFQSIILNWQIDGNFKYNPDLSTEVYVRFIPININTTKVILEHNHLDRMVDGKAVESMDQGWGFIMELYRQTAGTFQ